MLSVLLHYLRFLLCSMQSMQVGVSRAILYMFQMHICTSVWNILVRLPMLKEYLALTLHLNIIDATALSILEPSVNQWMLTVNSSCSLRSQSILSLLLQFCNLW